MGASGEQLEQSVAGEAEAEAVGDRPAEWDHDEGEEGGDGDMGLGPLNFAEAGEHQCANKN